MDPSAHNPTVGAETTPTPTKQTMEILDHRAAAPPMLRHRLFPRAMAWDLHQTSAAAYDAAESRLHKAPRVEHDRSSSPFSSESSSPSPRAPFNVLPPPNADSRERLFRTIGKWLDTPRDAPVHHHHHHHSDQYPRGYYSDRHQHQHQQPPSPPTSNYANFRHQPPTTGGLYDMVKLGSSISSPTGSSHPSPTHSSSSASSKKRQRGPTGSTAPHTNSSSSSSTTTSSVARPGMSTSSAKRCSVDNCGKIAVSKGLCRGHGGGRRCTFTGCTKCAQSRSPFCWAHGGGKRCEAPNCRRSRKTKRFCVDHVEMEATVPLPSATDSDDSGDYHSHANSDTETSSIGSLPPTTQPPTVGGLHLPSLSDALKRAVPAAVARATSGHTVSLPQSFDRLFPQQQPSTTASLTGRSWL